MTKVPNRQWVVLINKRPRGPLSEEEIRALMSKGLVRHNDLAFLVTEGKQQSEWKLLWQFPEFDRRKEPETTEKSEFPPVDKDRREPKTPDEIKDIAKGSLPTELMNLSPEDLLPKTTGPSQLGAHPENFGEGVERAKEESEKSWVKVYLWGTAVFGALLVGFVVMRFTGYSPTSISLSLPGREVNSPPSQVQAPERNVATPQRKPGVAPAKQPEAPPSAPVAREPERVDPPDNGYVEPTYPDEEARNEEEGTEQDKKDELAPLRRTNKQRQIAEDGEEPIPDESAEPPPEEPVD